MVFRSQIVTSENLYDIQLQLLLLLVYCYCCS